MKYDMDHLMRYYVSLGHEDKTRLLYYLGRQLSEARARVWIAERQE
jgi:hypothetical protein